MLELLKRSRVPIVASMHKTQTPLERFVFMACLAIAGESVFALPFHVTRFFRPTFLEVFELTNSQLGASQALYGVLAMLAYFPGGLLADHFSARKLLTLSLLGTSCGGLYMATIPSTTGLTLLFAFWGVSTILFFWAALIRACRYWGGAHDQGRAYGILDGGRGVLAAVTLSLAQILFTRFFPEDAQAVTPEERLHALQAVIYAYTAVTCAAGALTFFFVPEIPVAQLSTVQRYTLNIPWVERASRLWGHISTVLKLPQIWLQALIVICAYTSYKGLANYPVFARDVYHMNEVQTAGLMVWSAWVRPIAAVGAGFIGDRVRSSRVIIMGFGILFCTYLGLALGTPLPQLPMILTMNVLIASIATFALRGIYFALFEEGNVPSYATGTAVGLVSVLGYTPDIFVHIIGGTLLDRNPGLLGHQQFFLFMAASAALGLLASITFAQVSKSKST